MLENFEQRYVIKIYLKLNKYATETFASLNESYGDATLSKTMVFKWHKASKRAVKMLRTTVVLEDQSRQQIMKIWMWYEL